MQAFEEPSVFSRWTSRIAMFSVMLIATALVLHRLFGMPTPIALNLLKLSLAGAALAFLLGVMATIGIWRTGRTGTARVVVGIVASLALLSIPLFVAATARDYPEINDLTTDFEDVPQFVNIARLRGPTANTITYPGEAFARQQSQAYPDLVPMRVNRSITETYEIVIDAIKRQKLSIVSEQPPTGPGDAGLIEAFDRTLVLGLYGDVAIRVTGDDDAARIDVRSASRFGGNDLGANADRMRTIMKEIVVRLEETVPTADIERKGKKDGKPGVKRGQDDDPKSARRRKQQDPAQSGAQRGQAQKARQQGRADD